MKIILLMLVFFAFLSCKENVSKNHLKKSDSDFNNEVRNDLEIAGLKGKIKSIAIKHSFLDDDRNWIEEVQKYNLLGYLYEKEEFGNGEQKIIYKRDDKNNIVEERCSGFEAEGYSVNWMKKNTFNELNKLIQSKYFIEDVISTINQFKYDINGNLISNYTTFPKDIASEEVTLYKYDENKNILEKIDKTSVKKKYIPHFMKYIYKYDSRQNKIYESEVNEKGEVGISRKFKYDNNDNIVEEQYSYRNSKPFITKYFYNDNKLVKEKRYDSERGLEWYVLYVYDNTGNWIKRTTFETNGNVSINERIIEYYSANEKTSAEISDEKEVNYFNGEKLNTGDKIIKVNWGMENTTNFSRDFNKDNPRFSSEKLTVPSGKVWILLYIDEHYTFEGLKLDVVPQLFVDNKNIDWSYRRNFSNKSNVKISNAKIQNLIFQSNQTIFAVSDRQKGNGTGEDFYEYNGEMWFLETNLTSDMQQQRNTNDLKNIQEQNRDLEKKVDAVNRSNRVRRYNDEVQRKMSRGY